jgi:hypothetical protein
LQAFQSKNIATDHQRPMVCQQPDTAYWSSNRLHQRRNRSSSQEK